jgi:hypothetical protein
MFFKKTLFDRCFKLDDSSLLFKNTICFNYKNIYDDNYVVQGFTISRDYSLVSAYNKFHAKSRVYLYEKNGRFNKYIELDNSNHVGGISYDYINDLVYITGSKGNIDVYSYPELICGNIVKIKSDINISNVVGELLSAATLYFYDNKLYVCTFEGIGKMIVFDLEFSKNKVNVLSSRIINELPPAVQGVCVFRNNDKLLKKDDDFVKQYINASNASTGSKYDANANVENKNIVTLGQELHKGKNIQQNRYIMHNKIKTLYTKKLADQYIKDLESHVLYKHDESGTPGYPYCVAITMYPFLVDGLKKLGGQSVAPTDLKSYCGEFINLVYSVSSQFMGAVATPEFLMYMDYFIRKDYGDDYLSILDKQVELNKKGRTLEQVIENCFQQVVHSMNMPAGNRG